MAASQGHESESLFGQAASTMPAQQKKLHFKVKQTPKCLEGQFFSIIIIIIISTSELYMMGKWLFELLNITPFNRKTFINEKVQKRFGFLSAPEI